MKKRKEKTPVYDILGRLRKNYPIGWVAFKTACSVCENHGHRKHIEECEECMTEVQSHFKYNGHYPMGKETFLVACANCENKCDDKLSDVCIRCQNAIESGFKYKPRIADEKDSKFDMYIGSAGEERQIKFECSKCGYVHINPSVQHFDTCPGCGRKNK